MTAVTNQPLLAPDFSQIREESRAKYEQFFAWTAPENVQSYANGSSLERLADLAGSCRGIIQFTCPVIEGQEQWKLDRLSEVKERLSQAVECKRSYYDNHPFGIVTKYVLKLLDLFGFKMWNNGDTAAIVAAEDFLLMWDSRMPVVKISNPENRNYGLYSRREDFPPRNDHNRRAIDLTHFYNYTPRREIETGHPSNPVINYAQLTNPV